MKKDFAGGDDQPMEFSRRSMLKVSATSALFLTTGGLLTSGGCGSGAGNKPSISIDGSSTVFPINEAVAEEFGRVNKTANVTVGYSGTGGGFKKFIAGTIEICGASRPIKQKEMDGCKKAKVEYVELEVAFDGLAVVINPKNDWCESLTVAKLKELWRPGSAVKNWSDLDPKWPQKEIRLYGPGTDSGTFDYFTKAINGKEGASRTEYTPSENDNVLVNGVSKDPHALGYFGYAYYSENKDKLKLLAVDDGSGPVKPSEKSVRDGSYKPLSRPLFIYVRKDALKRKEVKDFVDFYLENAAKLVKEVGYVPVSDDAVKRNAAKLKGAAAKQETGKKDSGKKDADKKDAKPANKGSKAATKKSAKKG